MPRKNLKIDEETYERLRDAHGTAAWTGWSSRPATRRANRPGRRVV